MVSSLRSHRATIKQRSYRRVHPHSLAKIPHAGGACAVRKDAFSHHPKKFRTEEYVKRQAFAQEQSRTRLECLRVPSVAMEVKEVRA
jgi:hypothetical protein